MNILNTVYKAKSIFKFNKLTMETKWLLLGFFAKYFFRFMSTIILTRIFTPDVFGIMAIMFTVITGLQMISDIGIQASILQNKNSSDPNFLKTAWTLQIIRNIILCAVVIFISPQLSVSYDTPNLAIYMPILSLTIFIQGFKSTSVALYYKNVKVRELTIMEMIAQGFCFLVTIVLAYVLNSIWAFIIGLILAELLKLLYSYYFLIGGVVGIALDKKYSQEIIKFGKWIFLATAFTFIIGEGNKLIFGLFLTKHELGIYHVASMIALVPIALITEYNGKITLPKLTFTYNYKTSEFIQEFERRQNVTLLSFLTFTCLLMLSGNLIITTIYNENYFAAGKVFTILMMTVSFNTIFFSISPIFLSLGNSFYHMLNQKIYGISTVGFALLGYYINDYFGLLYGLVLASFLQTFVTLFLARRLIAVKYQNTLLSVFLVIIFIIISQLYSQ